MSVTRSPSVRETVPALMLSRAELDAVIFDMDGVVTDTAILHETAWRRLFTDILSHRADSTSDARGFTRADYLAYVDGKSRYDGARDFLDSRGIELPLGRPTDPPGRGTVSALANLKDRYFVELLSGHGVQVFDSTVRLVRQLRSLGMATAVISASRHCRSVLAAAGLAALFPVRVDGVDADWLRLPGKPDPAIFLEAAQRLDVSPDRAAVVEDAESGIVAARRGGFGLVIGVDRLGDPDRLARCGADFVVSDLAAIAVDDADGRRPRVVPGPRPRPAAERLAPALAARQDALNLRDAT